MTAEDRIPEPVMALTSKYGHVVGYVCEAPDGAWAAQDDQGRTFASADTKQEAIGLVVDAYLDNGKPNEVES